MDNIQNKIYKIYDIYEFIDNQNILSKDNFLNHLICYSNFLSLINLKSEEEKNHATSIAIIYSVVKELYIKHLEIINIYNENVKRKIKKVSCKKYLLNKKLNIKNEPNKSINTLCNLYQSAFNCVFIETNKILNNYMNNQKTKYTDDDEYFSLLSKQGKYSDICTLVNQHNITINNINYCFYECYNDYGVFYVLSDFLKEI